MTALEVFFLDQFLQDPQNRRFSELLENEVIETKGVRRQNRHNKEVRVNQ